MDVRGHNRIAWDRNVEAGNRWTQPVTQQVIDQARAGEFQVLLTPSRPVPRDWFPPLHGLKTLCLASAGGQQGPVLAAAGAEVTVLDNSPRQLAQDQLVADDNCLTLRLVEGDMADLSRFADGSFELVFHPCSNSFAENVIPIWRECHRVLNTGGVLLAGFTNPMRYIFDDERAENGNLEVRYALPYSDLCDLDQSLLKSIIDNQQPLQFGHTLEDQIGGQLQAGFLLTGFYEDRYDAMEFDPLSRYLATFMATRSLKA
ncbi:MAG: class I SAM-dependent methyltransferase [Planctomycetales bacterium]|nr:class I SAM-dependent methyltransferase [Planctomycetales bacterium]